MKNRGNTAMPHASLHPYSPLPLQVGAGRRKPMHWARRKFPIRRSPKRQAHEKVGKGFGVVDERGEQDLVRSHPDALGHRVN